MVLKSFEVLILPKSGDGRSFWTTVEAINISQAKKIAKARFPDDWKVGNNVRTIH